MWTLFLSPSIHAQSTEIRVLWKSSFNLFMLQCRSGKQLTELMVLLTPGKPCHKPGSVPPPPPTSTPFTACLLFEILKERRSLPKGLPANPCKLQMFSQAAHSRGTHFPSPVNICQTKKAPATEVPRVEADFSLDSKNRRQICKVGIKSRASR